MTVSIRGVIACRGMVFTTVHVRWGRGEGILALKKSFISTGLVSSMGKTAKVAIHHYLSNARNKHAKKDLKRWIS